MLLQRPKARKEVAQDPSICKQKSSERRSESRLSGRMRVKRVGVLLRRHQNQQQQRRRRRRRKEDHSSRRHGSGAGGEIIHWSSHPQWTNSAATREASCASGGRTPYTAHSQRIAALHFKTCNCKESSGMSLYSRKVNTTYRPTISLRLVRGFRLLPVSAPS